jgi:hypothetical protein
MSNSVTSIVGRSCIGDVACGCLEDHKRNGVDRRACQLRVERESVALRELPERVHRSEAPSPA